MNKPGDQSYPWCCLKIHGADSRTFLQGQLSNDVDLVTEQQAGFFALCTPKGRTISNFLLAPAPDGDPNSLLLLLPNDVADGVLSTLAKYIVFSKADLESAPEWQLSCLSEITLDQAGALGLSLPATKTWASSVSDQAVLIRCTENGERCLLISKAAKDNLSCMSASDWQLADIRDGIGFVRAITSDELVPQMLNMQLNNGISFTKGCYTGQEIVARSQYRGKIKRRMYRLALTAEACPEIGSAVLDDSGKNMGIVVSAAVSERLEGSENDYEMLAVLSLKDLVAPTLSVNGDNARLLDLPYAVNGDGEEE